MNEIGEYLKKTRTDKNITIEEAATATGIRAQYLEALEAGDYTKIPGEVFIKGFLRNYGNFLGVDGNGVVAHYNELLHKAEPVVAAAVVEHTHEHTHDHEHEHEHSHDHEHTHEATTEEAPSAHTKVMDAVEKPEEAEDLEATRVMSPVMPKVTEKPSYTQAHAEAMAQSNATEQKKGVFGKLKNMVEDSIYETYEEDEPEATTENVFASKKEDRQRLSDVVGQHSSSFFSFKVFFVCLIVFLAIAAAAFMMFLGGKKLEPAKVLKDTTSFSNVIKSEHSTDKTEKATTDKKDNATTDKSTEEAKKDETKAEATKADADKSSDKTDDKATDKSTDKAADEATTTVSGDDIKIELTFKKDVWTEVAVDGKGVEADTIKAGTTREFTGKEKVAIILGSRRDVEIKLNGKLVPYGETEWGTVEKIFTK